MTIEPSYRIDWVTFEERYPHEFSIAAQSDVIRPDNRLQAIADAWNEYLDSEPFTGESPVAWQKLSALLDALTEEDNDE